VAAVRVVGIVAAIFFAVLFFGIVDLTTAIGQTEGFYEVYLLETGWGLLYTVLLPATLLMWAVHPFRRLLPQQVFGVAVAMFVTGLLAQAPGQLLVSLVIAAVAAVPSFFLGTSVWRLDGLSVRGASRWLVVLVVVAVVAAAVYAWEMLDAHRAGVRDDVTLYLDHLPMQAAFAMALALSAAVAVLAGGARAPGWRAAALPSAVSAVWFGAVSVAYPEHLGSLGAAGGYVAIAWGVLFVGLAGTTGRSRER
jgi:hypothetical protein